MYQDRKLRPTKQRQFKNPIFGFDVETYDNNKEFWCASIVGDNYKEVFYDKESLIEKIKQQRFKGSFIAATNLSFDLMALLFNNKEMNNFRFLMRGSELIYAKTYIRKKAFQKESKNARPLTFIDTFNYARISVEKWGKILSIPKMETPPFIGKKPENGAQKAYMEAYNLRDSEISMKAVKFLYNSFYELGATPKMTIASTSMSLFKNNYLNNEYWRHDVSTLDDEFNAYYGGRTEAFQRGLIENYNYYDFNSLYPSVMRDNIFPDPNSLRKTYKDNLNYVHEFEGVSWVDLNAPFQEYPLLPYRTDNKLLFPYGDFSGWYTHVELRKAIEEGYTIKKVRKTYYYKKECEPFRDFVNDLYDLRKHYKHNKNRMEFVIKLLMNSLYGKFGQKFRNRDNLTPFNHTIEELNEMDYFERLGDFIRIKQPYSHPSSFCIPIWAAYITAYARLKLHKYIKLAHPVYVDTDSLITKKEFIDSDKLGKLKLEKTIKTGIIVKPKFYSIDGHVKVKGLGKKIAGKEFNCLLKNPSITYNKFTRLREALRRGLYPNEIIPITKEFSLEDDKRIWNSEFSIDELQSSRPHKIVEGITEKKYEEELIKAEDKRQTFMEKIMSVDEDLIDWNAKGDDISREEFIENEMWFENL